MSDIAIRVEAFGKAVPAGRTAGALFNIPRSLVNAANAPLRWLKGERRT